MRLLFSLVVLGLVKVLSLKRSFLIYSARLQTRLALYLLRKVSETQLKSSSRCNSSVQSWIRRLYLKRKSELALMPYSVTSDLCYLTTKDQSGTTPSSIRSSTWPYSVVNTWSSTTSQSLYQKEVKALSGNEAVDKMMSDLLKIVKRHNVWLGLISHLRKASGGGQSFEDGKLASIDDIKGSGSIKQISFDIVAFARNLVAEEEAERNTIRFRVLKSRFTGLTGDAGSATYDLATTRLKEAGGFDFEAIGL